MNGNYVRIENLSFSSIEIYMLFFLFASFAYILLRLKYPASVKLICMYLLALPYTDSVYRVMGVQISEIIIILIIFNDIMHKKIRVSKNPLCCFMVGFSIILCLFSTFSAWVGVYHNKVFGTGLTPLNSILNNFKFIMLIYVVNKIIVEINTRKRLELILSIIRFSGNIAAFTTITQAVLYKLGFFVPGIFEMWGIPRAKGLSHEPATNAFVLLTTLSLSTLYVADRKIVVHRISLVFQLIAFVICFSTGAIPLLFAYVVVFLFFMYKESVITKKAMQRIMLISIVIALVIIGMLKTEAVSQAFGKLNQKLFSILSDYRNGTDRSGRGSDMQGIRTVMEQNPIFGIGAFNSTIFFKNNSNTNTYFILIMELGLGGILLLVPLLFLYIRYFALAMKKIKGKILYANVSAFFIISLIAIAWLRILFFHQIWMVLAVGFSVVNSNRSVCAIGKLSSRNDINTV